jgi:hypothetical protein
VGGEKQGINRSKKQKSEKRNWPHETVQKITKLKKCGEVASVRIPTAAPLFFAIESYVANLVQFATMWRIFIPSPSKQ